MLGKIAALLILVSLFEISFSQGPTKQEIVKAGIKGIVTSLYFEDDAERSPSYIYIESYDILGNLILITYYSDHDKSITSKEQFFYNERGQLCKRELIRYSNKNNSLDSTLEISIYEYNEHDLLTKNEYDEPFEYVFDSLGRVIEIIEPYPEEHPCIVKTTYVYSRSGLLANEILFDTKYNYIQHEIFYNYTSNGKLSSTRYRYFTYYGELRTQKSEYKMKYFYDAKGLLVRITQRQTKVPKYDKREPNRISVIEYQYY